MAGEDSVPVLTIDSGRSVDAEIEVQLENINKAIEEINTLSQMFLRARDEFIKQYESGRCQLAVMYKNNKKMIDKARPFYIARDNTYKAKCEHRKWTRRYKEICEDLEDAKENARTAEHLLISSASSGSGGTTDPELLSNLNKANDRVIHLTQNRDEADKHQRESMTVLSQCDEHLANMAQQLSKYVLKASSYFELRDKLQRQLDAEYYKLWRLNQNVHEAKQKYKDMFSQYNAVCVEFMQVKSADDIQVPRDLSQFEEIEDVSSLDSNFLDDDGSTRRATSESLELASLHSNPSTLEGQVSHVTNPAHALTAEDLRDPSLSDDFDANESRKQELCLDYGVSFRLDV